jgi:hypothetical protein
MEHSAVARTEVTVVDVQMPFGSMVVFILKWTLAAIPAMIILFILGMILAMVAGGFVASLIPGDGVTAAGA